MLVLILDLKTAKTFLSPLADIPGRLEAFESESGRPIFDNWLFRADTFLPALTMVKPWETISLSTPSTVYGFDPPLPVVFERLRRQ